MGFWAVVIASVVLVFLWGLISPRSQWKVLAAWSYRKPQADEPSSFVFGVQRVLSAIGILFFLAVGATGIGQYLASLPPPPPTLTALQQMWGIAPAPQVVNRIVSAGTTDAEGLVEVPVTGFQMVNNEEHRPRYLHLLKRFEPGVDIDKSGILGAQPSKDFPALDSAELVVNVRVFADCIPRKAIVVESDTAVQIGVYVGQPNRADDVPLDHLSCGRAPLVQHSLLLPVNLAAELGDRQVQSLDGSRITEVKEVRKQ